jgi:hypothetical protein
MTEDILVIGAGNRLHVWRKTYDCTISSPFLHELYLFCLCISGSFHYKCQVFFFLPSPATPSMEPSKFISSMLCHLCQ